MTFRIGDMLYRGGFIWRRILTQTWLRLSFGSIGRGTTIYRLGMLKGADRVHIGARTLIRYGCRIETVTHQGEWTPRIEIGNGVNIEQNVHIVCQDRILIGDDVSITANCAIVDTTHPASAVFEGGKIGAAILLERNSVEIGRGTFVGIGTVILPGSKIGENCVIGAGSVVTGAIPANSVAVGSPARVVRKNEISGERE